MSRFGDIVDSGRLDELEKRASKIAQLLAGRTVFNVNSTGKGGGVAELLSWLLGYIRGAGVNARWCVIEGTPAFFMVTKRLHNMLHGEAGDGLPLTDSDAETYRTVLGENAADIRALISNGDVVVLHDPQTAGLVPAAKEAGAIVVWRCHVGREEQNELTEGGWNFLKPYLEQANALVFSRKEHIPEWARGEKTVAIPPSIDPFATKNRPLPLANARAILAHTGILRHDGYGVHPEFVKSDGSIGRVNRMADLVQTGPAPSADLKTVVQVSRWDRLKDMAGVMDSFSKFVDGPRESRLILAGPVVTGVADDPEGGRLLTKCIEQWRELPHFERSRVQLVCLPMFDFDENAAIVNALQTHATVVVQKSLQEGFGLTVTEAMWKGKAVVASAIGGIQDQIVHGESGLLVKDPTDGREFGAAVQSALDDDALNQQLGANARRRVQDLFLGDRHLLQYADLLERLCG